MKRRNFLKAVLAVPVMGIVPVKAAHKLKPLPPQADSGKDALRQRLLAQQERLEAMKYDTNRHWNEVSVYFDK